METPAVQMTQTLKPTERLQQLLPELFNPQPVSGEQFLRLQLTPDLTIALALSWVEETLLISPQLVTPIPNMPPHALGLLSSKGQVFWAINLVQLLNLPMVLEPSQYYEVVVIRTLPGETDQNMGFQSTLFLGLVVPKIKGSIRLSLEDIVSPVNEVEIGLQPYLSGQLVVDGQTILVLSAEAIGTSQMSMPG
ncbi:chemotaxis protein CheW [Leptothoe sp. PORK10 BA2]|uniref:chemotaxis protein CheW n=1 Tax=Leptothoe sp. PORK10 BA2 TaxID=3110254 RepID=UPI002B1FD2B0|nr:chemotaxis protein CheW [Leptothoe sp. PORK10 BA2]MEA5466303.1 chemotaxis protein CheW [Leptothoe sp. PORK10 BA2]